MAGAGRGGAFAALAEGLMQRHYDPRYEKHRSRMGVPVVEIEAGGLGPQEIPALVERVAEAVERGVHSGQSIRLE